MPNPGKTPAAPPDGFEAEDRGMHRIFRCVLCPRSWTFPLAMVGNPANIIALARHAAQHARRGARAKGGPHTQRLIEIVEARRDGLTYAELGLIADLTPQAVHKILNGHAEPQLGSAARLLAAVGATLADLETEDP